MPIQLFNLNEIQRNIETSLAGNILKIQKQSLQIFNSFSRFEDVICRSLETVQDHLLKTIEKPILEIERFRNSLDFGKAFQNSLEKQLKLCSNTFSNSIDKLKENVELFSIQILKRTFFSYEELIDKFLKGSRFLWFEKQEIPKRKLILMAYEKIKRLSNRILKGMDDNEKDSIVSDAIYKIITYLENGREIVNLDSFVYSVLKTSRVDYLAKKGKFTFLPSNEEHVLIPRVQNFSGYEEELEFLKVEGNFSEIETEILELVFSAEIERVKLIEILVSNNCFSQAKAYRKIKTIGKKCIMLYKKKGFCSQRFEIFSDKLFC